ncbi:MAG: thiamine-phosphate kinase [Zoogloeaceae bacterium]|nr:thiamine-phosphate kinase [Zoogloeaceae bacterium]
MPSEFDLIRQYFTRNGRHTDLGVGDDAALFTPTPGTQLAVSTDMLVSGTHFLPDTDPRDLGWKTLAVNVSDIAAMGGQPRWALLALALPNADEAWIAAFARGLFDCAEAFGVDLIGGDTTRGPLNLSVTIFGEVPAGTAVQRNGAHHGDDVWVTGQPGRAALGLAHLQGRIELSGPGAAECVAALQRPQPRVAAGLALRGLASAMLDVSDGLAGDLKHILEQSGVGADIDVVSLPLVALTALGASPEAARDSCLSGGDDYELLFTAAPRHRADIDRAAARLGRQRTRIGRLTPTPGLRIVEADGRLGSAGGYDHFA